MEHLCEIIKIAEKVSEQDGSDWNEDTSIMMDLELSSMEFFSFIAEIEGVFGIRLKPREVNRLETLGDISRVGSEKTMK